VSLPLSLLPRDLPGSVLPEALILLTCFGVALPAWMFRRYRSMGVLRLSNRPWMPSLRALLHSLCLDRRRVPGVGGLVVIGVPDDDWRNGSSS
jgi:hypothetical protein